MVSGSVEHLLMGQLSVGRWSTCRWVGGRWSVGQWRTCRWVGVWLSVVDGLSVVGGFVISLS